MATEEKKERKVSSAQVILGFVPSCTKDALEEKDWYGELVAVYRWACWELERCPNHETDYGANLTKLDESMTGTIAAFGGIRTVSCGVYHRRARMALRLTAQWQTMNEIARNHISLFC